MLRPLKLQRIPKATLVTLMMGATLLLFFSCGEKKEPGQGSQVQVPSDSFTFFELGKSSRFSESVRENLSAQLGHDAIEKRSILDLEINYHGFLQEYFPALHALNLKLNPPTGERIEHHIVKLMYRYARKENVPFDFVELVFSNYSRFPLLFKINFKEDEANIVKTLKAKYGEPRQVDWKNKSGQSMYWQKNGDVMMISLVPDQFGTPEYQIRIFFAENIQALLEKEKTEKEKQELQRAKSGQKAF